MIFAEPELLWLSLAAPAAAGALLWLWRRRLAAASAWAARGLWDRLLAVYSRRRLGLSVALLAAAVLATSLALARPKWGLSGQTVERRGVDVVFVLDSSLSMAALDVPPSRLFTAKSLIRRITEATPQNRVALVQVEGTGEVLTPLTVDGSVIDLLLDTVEPGSLPQPGTALAVALETGLGLFLEGDTRHRVMVVISDGEDHRGGLEGVTERLVEAGVVTHTLGLGTLSGAPVPIPGGERGEMKRDEEGRVVISRLDEAVLESLARSTGGVYLRVANPAVDLAPLLRRFAEMGTQTLETETVEVLEERFQWPTAGAAAALALYLGLGPFRPLRRLRRSNPGRGGDLTGEARS